MQRLFYFLWLLIAGGGVVAQTLDSCYVDCRPGARCRGDLRALIPGQGCVSVDSIRPATVGRPSPPLPLCLEYDERYRPPFHELRKQVYRWDPVTGTTIDVDVLLFSVDSLWQDLCCAQRLWACVCGAQNNPCVCTVKVRFVQDFLEFSQHPGDRFWHWVFRPRQLHPDSSIWTFATAATTGYYTPFRNLECDTGLAVIYLNSRSDWMTRSLDWRSQDTSTNRFFVNRSLSGNVRIINADTFRFGAYDLCIILAHELGHLYGMGHHDVCDSSYTGVMLSQTYRSEGFTEDDRCIFAKLYCPDLVGVQEARRQEAVRERLNSVCVPVPEGGARIGVRVYNLYGALVLQLPEQYHSGGQWCQELPTERLATGVYLCVVSVERQQYRQLVLVIR